MEIIYRPPPTSRLSSERLGVVGREEGDANGEEREAQRGVAEGDPR